MPLWPPPRPVAAPAGRTGRSQFRRRVRGPGAQQLNSVVNKSKSARLTEPRSSRASSCWTKASMRPVRWAPAKVNRLGNFAIVSEAQTLVDGESQIAILVYAQHAQIADYR